MGFLWIFSDKMDNKIIIFDEKQNEEIISQIKGYTVTFRWKKIT